MFIQREEECLFKRVRLTLQWNKNWIIRKNFCCDKALCKAGTMHMFKEQVKLIYGLNFWLVRLGLLKENCYYSKEVHREKFSECFFRSMQSMADVVLLRISVGSFPSFQLGVKFPDGSLLSLFVTCQKKTKKNKKRENVC